jgi:ATP-dependent Clp protease ATP-binding subunit ClpC
MFERTSAVESAIADAAALAGGNPIASHHLLMAALKDPNNSATRALAGAGVDVVALVEALATASVVGSTDEPPAERGGHELTLRLDGETLTVTTSEPTLLELAHAAWERLGLDGAELSGRDDRSTPLAELWSALSDVLDSLGRPRPDVTPLPARPRRRP